MFKQLFEFLMILNGIQTNSILSFHKQRRQARAKSSEYIFTVSRHVALKLAFHRGRTPTKMGANFSLLSHRIRMCECTACVCLCNVLCKANVSFPALPVRLPGSASALLICHYFTYVKLQTAEGRKCREKIFFEVSSTISLFKPTSSNLLNLA